MYIQDQWQIHPRLTLSLGVRTERETIPSYNRDVQDVAIKFGWADKWLRVWAPVLIFWQRQNEDLRELGPFIRLDQI